MTAIKTKIEWCDYTFNPWWGCTKVSAGCDNCYAERLAARFGPCFGDNPRRIFGDKHWAAPLRWNRMAEKTGRRASVFCGSMCDVFEGRLELDAPRRRLFDLVSETTELDWLLLTKRPKSIEPILQRLYNTPGKVFEDQEAWDDPITLPNVWMGVTVENKEVADSRILSLLDMPVEFRFLSCEPLLGPLDLYNDKRDLIRGLGRFGQEPVCPGIDGVIVGGESGPGARPMHPDWARSIRDQCAEAGVPFFMKQMSGTRTQQLAIPYDLMIRQLPWRLNEKAGRLT